MALDPTVIELAMRQGGIATRKQLTGMQLSPYWIDREVAAGRLKVVKAGVYRVVTMTGHEDLLRAATTTLPSAIVSHESAAHRLRFPKPPPLRPTVTVRSRTTHVFPGVTVRRTDDLRPDHIVVLDGLRTTNVMRTVFDLASLLPERALGELIEDLVIIGRLDLVSFSAFTHPLCRKGKPGSRAISATIDRRLRSGAPNATSLEHLGLRVLRETGLPEPALEHPAPWNTDERIDAAYPPQRIGIEWDSRSWHASIDQMANDRRRDRLAALEGWTILRYTWQDLTDRPGEVGEQIRILLKGPG